MSSAEPSIFKLPDGRSLRYRLTFPDEPHRPIVLLSGLLATTGAVWDAGVVEVLKSNFRVLTYDHPGHGGSSAPADLGANTFEAMAADVHALLSGPVLQQSQEKGSPALHAWIGCSLGAATGVVFATRYPYIVNNLVVCDTVTASPANAGIEDGLTPRVKAVRKAGSLDEALAGTRERWLGKEWLAANPDKEAWLSKLMSETTLNGFEACIAALVSRGFDLGKLAPKVASSVNRVLLVVGEKDAPLPMTMKTLAEQIRAAFISSGKDDAEDRVQFRVLPNAGHASFLDAFDEWSNVVIPFLR